MNMPLAMGYEDLEIQRRCFDGYLESFFKSELASPQELYKTVPEDIQHSFYVIVLQYLNIITKGDDFKANCKKLTVRIEFEQKKKQESSQADLALTILLNCTRKMKLDITHI